MYADQWLTRMVSCPKCGLYNRVTFVYNSVGVDQRCIGCGEYAWFELPTALTPLVDSIKRYFLWY